MSIENRYEFVLLFDVENGNPNGDPDAGNMPRVDPETGFGIVTDVCLKRKIRDYVSLVKENESPFKIYVRKGDIAKARAFMCENYYDVRAFGAVMSTGDAVCGQVRGPVQINFARSIDPIVPRELSITRCAVTKKEDEKKERTIGKKYIVPYALYRAEGYVSASLAQKKSRLVMDGTGFDETDLNLLWEALMNLFEHDHSAARGKMVARKLFVFKHDSILGCAPSHILFEKIKVTKKCDGPARSFSDYVIELEKEDNMPNGVKLIEML